MPTLDHEGVPLAYQISGNGDPVLLPQTRIDADIIELCVRWYITYRTILVWAWSAAPWLVAESGMGNGTRIEEGHEARKAAN